MGNYYLQARTPNAQGFKVLRPNRLARGVQEVLNRKRPIRKPNGQTVKGEHYNTLLKLAVHGTCDSLAHGVLAFRVRKQVTHSCLCCGQSVSKLRLIESKREFVQRRIKRIKQNLGII